MKVEKLLEIASKGYPEDAVKDASVESGDGLAVFIRTELEESFDEDADDNDQLENAIGDMETAVEEIQSVIRYLEEAKR